MATMAMAGQEMERMQVRRPEAGRAVSMSERNRSLYEQQLARRRGPTRRCSLLSTSTTAAS